MPRKKFPIKISGENASGRKDVLLGNRYTAAGGQQNAYRKKNDYVIFWRAGGIQKSHPERNGGQFYVRVDGCCAPDSCVAAAE